MKAPFPTPWHLSRLEREEDLAPGVREAFRRDGHVLVRGALDGKVLGAARAAIEEAVETHGEARRTPELDDAYSRAFKQIVNLSLDAAELRALVHSPRLARMAAELMGADGVRLFCEDWLIKEPGAPITPWHQDSAVMPFDTRRTVTAWIPLQPIGKDCGRLRFARGSHRAGTHPVENISDGSEKEFERIIRDGGWPIEDNPPMRLGDVSFHDGAMIHGAHPNAGGAPRVALALHFFADGALVKEPTTPTMRDLLRDFAPEARVGAPAAGRLWPLLWRREGPVEPRLEVRTRPRALHIKAVLVPGGEGPVDVWVQEGRIRFDPILGAEEAAPEGGWLTSGLTDCHAHLSWPHSPELRETVRTREFIDGNRGHYARKGVTALRDMGSPTDDVCAAVDRPGLPRVRAAGMLVLPHEGFPFTPTRPENLVRAFLERLENGADWIKVFTDWTTDWEGTSHPGFSPDDRLTYPLPVLRDAVEAAHQAGARVAAHCFTRAGAEAAVLAGADSLEHGWGVDAALADEMARRGIAWTPLAGIARTMWDRALRERDAKGAAWILASMKSMARLLPYAVDKGVRVFAGTDWYPSPSVADEVRELKALGLDAEYAAGAGAWAARRWLGEPGLEEGAPADLVLFRGDPRKDLRTLDAPALILLGGERVEAAERPRPAAAFFEHVAASRRRGA